MKLSFGAAMMRPSQTVGLALPAALLLLLAVLLLLPASPAPAPIAPAAIPASGPQNTINGGATQWRTIMLARPLFNSTRRPVQAAVADTDVTLPRLSAIIVIGGVRGAIFDTGQAATLVREGGDIAGYHVTTIAPDEVDLTGPQGRLTLRPQFQGAAAADAPSAAAAPPPPPNPSQQRRLDDDPI